MASTITPIKVNSTEPKEYKPETYSYKEQVSDLISQGRESEAGALLQRLERNGEINKQELDDSEREVLNNYNDQSSSNPNPNISEDIDPPSSDNSDISDSYNSPNGTPNNPERDGDSVEGERISARIESENPINESQNNTDPIHAQPETSNVKESPIHASRQETEFIRREEDEIEEEEKSVRIPSPQEIIAIEAARRQIELQEKRDKEEKIEEISEKDQEIKDTSEELEEEEEKEEQQGEELDRISARLRDFETNRERLIERVQELEEQRDTLSPREFNRQALQLNRSIENWERNYERELNILVTEQEEQEIVPEQKQEQEITEAREYDLLEEIRKGTNEAELINIGFEQKDIQELKSWYEDLGQEEKQILEESGLEGLQEHYRQKYLAQFTPETRELIEKWNIDPSQYPLFEDKETGLVTVGFEINPNVPPPSPSDVIAQDIESRAIAENINKAVDISQKLDLQLSVVGSGFELPERYWISVAEYKWLQENKDRPEVAMIFDEQRKQHLISAGISIASIPISFVASSLVIRGLRYVAPRIIDYVKRTAPIALRSQAGYVDLGKIAPISGILRGQLQNVLAKSTLIGRIGTIKSRVSLRSTIPGRTARESRDTEIRNYLDSLQRATPQLSPQLQEQANIVNRILVLEGVLAGTENLTQRQGIIQEQREIARQLDVASLPQLNTNVKTLQQLVANPEIFMETRIETIPKLAPITKVETKPVTETELQTRPREITQVQPIEETQIQTQAQIETQTETTTPFTTPRLTQTATETLRIPGVLRGGITPVPPAPLRAPFLSEEETPKITKRITENQFRSFAAGFINYGKSKSVKGPYVRALSPDGNTAVIQWGTSKYALSLK